MTHSEAVKCIHSAGLVGPSHGNLKRVKELLDLAPDLIDAMNAVDPSQVDETPQGAAAHTQSEEILKCYLDRGVRADIFMLAALGEAERVTQRLHDDPHLIHAKGSHGIPLIAHAADASTATAMVTAGVECNIFLAAQLGLADHTAKLIHSDPELLSLHSPGGLTPLQLARMYQNKDVVKVLLEAGAQDPDGAGAAFLIGQETRDADRKGALYSNVCLGVLRSATSISGTPRSRTSTFPGLPSSMST